MSFWRQTNIKISRDLGSIVRELLSGLLSSSWFLISLICAVAFSSPVINHQYTGFAGQRNGGGSGAAAMLYHTRSALCFLILLDLLFIAVTAVLWNCSLYCDAVNMPGVVGWANIGGWVALDPRNAQVSFGANWCFTSALHRLPPHRSPSSTSTFLSVSLCPCSAMPLQLP